VGKEFLPALAFRRRRISYFALQNAPPRKVVIQNPVKIFEKKRLWQEDNRFPA